MNEKLHELLSKLRLKGMAGALDQEIQRAEREGAPASEVVYRLLLEEQTYRQSQSLSLPAERGEDRPGTGRLNPSPSTDSRA